MSRVDRMAAVCDRLGEKQLRAHNRASVASNRAAATEAVMKENRVLRAEHLSWERRAQRILLPLLRERGALEAHAAKSGSGSSNVHAAGE